MKTNDIITNDLCNSHQEEDSVATYGVKAQHRGHLERYSSSQRVGWDWQALHSIREPPGSHKSWCRSPQRAPRSKVDGETGKRVRNLPRSRGALQPVLRRDHPSGHPQWARAWTLAAQSQRRNQDDYRCLLDSLSVIRYFRHEKAIASRAW